MDLNKFTGSVMLIVGTIVGSGMFALPLVGANAGFSWSSLLMGIMWIFAVLSGLLFLEANLALPAQNASFSSMTERTLGKNWKFVVWLLTIFLLYTMLVAYVVGESDILVEYFAKRNYQISHTLVAVSFTTVLGGAVYWSMKAADYFNRFLLVFKALFIVMSLLLLLPLGTSDNLVTTHSCTDVRYLLMATPSFLCAFCYQFAIPSLRIYMGDQPKALRATIVIGTAFAALVYILWLAAVMGIVPLDGPLSFASLKASGGSIGASIQLINRLSNGAWVKRALDSFSIVAMTTSFIGVSLSLFDFLKDGLKRSDSLKDRGLIALITFVPPLYFAIYYPGCFIFAFNYASIAVAGLCIMLPAAMVYHLRKNQQLSSPYRVCGGNRLLALVFSGGLISMVLAILYILGKLPGLF